MKIEVWSDIACPFCYIGKHHFEQALKQFEDAEAVELEWKSFQLDPDLSKDTSYASTYTYLAERKGVSQEQAKELTAGVKQAGEAAGLTLNFGQTIIANTFDAHRLLHFAKRRQLGNELKETLFRAHFTDGMDISGQPTLVALAREVGLDEAAVQQVLASEQYAYEVSQDIQEARNMGIRGVPFFVFNRKYAISGAQPIGVFLQTLEKSVAEWRVVRPKISVEVNTHIKTDQNCDD